MLDAYAMSLGESVSSGPFFKAYVANLLPGQFVQPFIDAAFSDLGLDPNTLLPSQRTDPQTGQPGTPPLPMPYPRTGQGGAPNLKLPDAITGNPGDQQCGPRRGARCPAPGCYPYREPLPARRPAVRRRDRPRWRRQGWDRPAADPERRYSCPHRASRRRTPAGPPGGRPMNRMQWRTPWARIALASVLVVVLASAVTVVRATDRPTEPHVVGLLRQQQRHVRRRRRAHPRCPVGKIDKIEPQPSGSRSPSGSTTSTRCPPTPRP